MWRSVTDGGTRNESYIRPPNVDSACSRGIVTVNSDAPSSTFALAFSTISASCSAVGCSASIVRTEIRPEGDFPKWTPAVERALGHRRTFTIAPCARISQAQQQRNEGSLTTRTFSTRTAASRRGVEFFGACMVATYRTREAQQWQQAGESTRESGVCESLREGHRIITDSNRSITLLTFTCIARAAATKSAADSPAALFSRSTPLLCHRARLMPTQRCMLCLR